MVIRHSQEATTLVVVCMGTTPKRIIAHAFGDRSTETLNVLLMMMKQFNVAFWCTDKFKAYDILLKENTLLGNFILNGFSEKI